MKIILVATNTPGKTANDGIGSFVTASAKELAVRGNDVHVISRHDKDFIKIDGYML